MTLPSHFCFFLLFLPGGKDFQEQKEEAKEETEASGGAAGAADVGD